MKMKILGPLLYTQTSELYLIEWTFLVQLTLILNNLKIFLCNAGSIKVYYYLP